MKKRALFSVLFALLAGCADKNQYEQAVLERMQAEKDIQDYNINPQHMTDCVIDLTSKKMPGFFPFDPKRMAAYRNYTKMLTLSQSEDPEKTMEELRTSFGSPQALSEAHKNYTESTMNCISAIVMESEESAKEGK